MTDTFDYQAEKIAHRRCTKYQHNAGPGEPMYSFTAAHLLDFARELRDELEKGQEPIGYANSDELDNMLDDRTATIAGIRCGWRKTALYAHPFVAAPAGVPDGWRDLLSEIISEADEFEQRTGGKVAGSWLVRAKAMLSAAPADAVAKDAEYQITVTGRRIEFLPSIEAYPKKAQTQAQRLAATIDAAMQGKESGNG